MTRFMMTIQDAVSLVLQAARVSRGGELFILRMRALRVSDLVEVFVEEYASRRGWDPAGIVVREIGARAGEKLHEDLVTAEECARMQEEPNMFVVQPRWRVNPDAVDATTPPADCHSGTAELLDRDEIRSLLEETGLLESVGLDTPLTSMLEEPVL